MVNTCPASFPNFFQNINSYKIPLHLRSFFRHILFVPQDMIVPSLGDWPSTIHCPFGSGKEHQNGRYQTAFEHFSKNLTDCSWLYICDDDTMIRHDNLLKLVREMSKNTDPSTDLIAKANANLEFSNLYFIGGGCGCLFSRGMIDYLLQSNFSFLTYAPKARYHQTDAIMTIPLRKIWHTIEWHEPAMQTYGFQWQSHIDHCPKNVDVVRMKDIVSFHSIQSQTINVEKLNLSRNCDDNLMFFLDRFPWSNIYMSHGLTLCNGSNSKRVVSYSEHSIQKRLAVKHLHTMRVPLFTKAQFDALPDDNIPRLEDFKIVSGMRLIGTRK